MSDGRRDEETLDALAEDFVERLRRGEAPDTETYVEEHPNLAERIRSLFPLLSVIEGVSASAPSTDPDAPGDAPRAGPTFDMPREIGRYRIVESLGRGGMGRVFRARRSDADADAPAVAIKVIHPHLAADAGCLARFLREAEAGRRIRHRNVVRTLEAGVVELSGVEAPFLVLEYVEGQTLRALLDEVGRVPERLCRLVGRRIADALAAIHAQGIVHRDIKPANVLITADETVKVMDLGVALLQDEAFQLSGTGEFVGSLLYAAPEQLDGRRADARTDLYALGLTLHELAAGRLPQRAPTGSFTPLPYASPFFTTVVRSLLERDPAARFPSAARLRDVLAAGERSPWWRRRDRGRSNTHAWLRAEHAAREPELQGREEELATLTEAYERAREGEGRTVYLRGDAGVGKSRLVYEWLQQIERAQPGLRAVVVHHAPGSDVAPTPPLAEALVNTFGLKRLQEWIGTALHAGSPLAQALARLVSEGDGGLAAALPPASLATAWLRLLRTLARAEALVVVFEDLHFAGHDARELFMGLARGLRSDPLLLVGTTRPHPEADASSLAELSNVTTLQLGGLSASRCRALLRAACHDERLLADEATLIRKSDGNPFFLLEMVRTLRDREPSPPADSESTGSSSGLPSTIRSIIERRLSRLTERQRELLEAGACCGYEFDPTLVAEAAQLPLLRALKRFARLERTTGLLRASGKNYAFRHHLVQEVLHEEMHPSLREAYHASIGGVVLARLESRDRSGDAAAGPDAAAVCRHLFAGRKVLDATAFVLPALRFLVPRGEFLRAIELAEAALEATGLLVGSDRAEAQRLLSHGLQSVSRYDAARRHLEAAIELADTLDGCSHATRGRRDLGELLERLAEHEGALRMHREAAELATATGDGLEEARARLGLAGVLMRQRHLAEAYEQASACVDLIPAEGHELVELEAVHTLAQIHVRCNEREHARPLLERAWELARRVGNRNREIAVISTLGHLSFRSGDYLAAHGQLERAIDLASELGNRDDLPHLRINAALCLDYLGRAEEGQAVIERALAEATSMGHETARLRAQARLGEILLRRGHLERALIELEAAHEEAARVGDVAAEQASARGLARALAGVGQNDKAAAILDAWRERVRDKSRDAPPVPASVLTIRAQLLENAGRTDEALALYEQAWERRQQAGSPLAVDGLLLGQAYARSGRTQRAQEMLEAALELSRSTSAPLDETMASVYLATLPGGDLLKARLLLERHEAALSLPGRVEANFVLWKTWDEGEHLRAAKQHLDDLLAHAPARYRDSMLRNVTLYRRVNEAWLANDA